jgi:hypothetical protein
MTNKLGGSRKNSRRGRTCKKGVAWMAEVSDMKYIKGGQRDQ